MKKRINNQQTAKCTHQSVIMPLRWSPLLQYLGLNCLIKRKRKPFKSAGMNDWTPATAWMFAPVSTQTSQVCMVQSGSLGRSKKHTISSVCKICPSVSTVDSQIYSKNPTHVSFRCVWVASESNGPCSYSHEWKQDRNKSSSDFTENASHVENKRKWKKLMKRTGREKKGNKE